MKIKCLILGLIPFLMVAQNNPPANYTVKNVIVGDNDHVFLNLHTNTAILYQIIIVFSITVH